MARPSIQDTHFAAAVVTDSNGGSGADKLPDQSVIDLLWLGNIHGQWEPFIQALRSGQVDIGYRRRARDGSTRPTLLSMLVINAPLAVIKEALCAGAHADPDHLLGAAASGDLAKLNHLLALGLDPRRMSGPPEMLLVAAVNSGRAGMLQRVWKLGLTWPVERLRNGMRVFDAAARRGQSLDLLGFLLDKGIGPSEQALSQGMDQRFGEAVLSKDVRYLLLDKGWAVPGDTPAQEHFSEGCCASTGPRLH